MDNAHAESKSGKPSALSMLVSSRPRTLGWLSAAGLLFGDWGTSRLYVLGLALLFAGRTSFWLIVAMSALVLAVGWAYAQICRLYPDGGGVYTAARKTSRVLAVVGALLLFADYTVTASLSVLDGYHYFGLPTGRHVQHNGTAAQNVKDAGPTINTDPPGGETVDLNALPDHLTLPDKRFAGLSYDASAHQLRFDGEMTSDVRERLDNVAVNPDWRTAIRDLYVQTRGDQLFAWDSPALWAIVTIALIGAFNLLGPQHSAGFALFAALGMVVITLLIVCFAIPRLRFTQDAFGNPAQHPFEMWRAFVSIVLALSGCEAIANLTGVMRKPVSVTASKAIFSVALEVAVFNIILGLAMLAIYPLDRSAHVNDMLAYLTGKYVGPWGEWPVRIIGGLLLVSAGNTAVNGIMSILYVMSRDGEMPAAFQKLNRFGAPWVGAMVAAGVPIVVLLIIHDLTSLAELYAMGVVGAIVINVTLCTIHPRLRRIRRKVPMALLAVLLGAIWITLAFTKLHALAFVSIVLAIGLTLRAVTQWLQKRKGPRVSLLRQAILEQLTPDAMFKPKLLVGTYGSDALAPAALVKAKESGAALVVCFIRQVALSYKFEQQFTFDTDLAAVRVFANYLRQANAAGVMIIPVYDTGIAAAELIAESAAIYGCDRVLIGSSRKGAFFHLLKGAFQQQLEEILPPEVQVEVLSDDPVIAAGEGTTAAVA